jgi:hypothetical protein
MRRHRVHTSCAKVTRCIGRFSTNGIRLAHFSAPSTRLRALIARAHFGIHLGIHTTHEIGLTDALNSAPMRHSTTLAVARSASTAQVLVHRVPHHFLPTVRQLPEKALLFDRGFRIVHARGQEDDGIVWGRMVLYAYDMPWSTKWRS